MAAKSFYYDSHGVVRLTLVVILVGMLVFLSGQGTATQAEASLPTEGEVRATYIGHACFVLETADGVQVVMDPMDPQAMPYADTYVLADIVPSFVTVSHRHADHDQVAQYSGSQIIWGVSDDGNFVPVDVEIAGVQVTSVPTDHWYPPDAGSANAAIVLELEGMKLVHLGDAQGTIQQGFSDQQLALLTNPDVLLIPVDADYWGYPVERLVEAVQALSPRVVIPMHFWSTAEKEEFLDAMGVAGFAVQHFDSNSITLAANALPTVTEVWDIPYGAYAPPSGPSTMQLPSPRWYAPAVTALDGKVYVFGGRDADGNRFSDIIEFDPVSGLAMKLEASLPTGRAATGAALGGNGKIYVFGGRDDRGRLRDIIEFDPETRTVTKLESTLPGPRSMIVAAPGENGSIYIFGGFDGVKDVADIVRFDPATGAMEKLAVSLPAPSSRMAAATGSNGKIYLFAPNAGEEEMLELDPTAETISGLGIAFVDSVFFEAAASGHDGTIYALGHINRGGQLSPLVWAFDPATGVTKVDHGSASLHPTPGYYGSAAANGDIYIFGGMTPEGAASAEILRFTPGTASWLLPESVSIVPGRLTVVTGWTAQARVVVSYGNGIAALDAADVTSGATWESSHPEIASVDRGTVIGLEPGEAIVSASWRGLIGQATVKVVPFPRELTVDDDGQDYPGADFTSIQAAVQAASPGDTIVVYPGTYAEQVNVNKELTLKGIGLPVVDAGGGSYASAITLNADGCVVEGFKIVGGGSFGAGIMVKSDNNMLAHNTATNNYAGIYLERSSNNYLVGNIASGNDRGIYLRFSSHNTLIGNTAGSNSWYGIELWDASNNLVVGNTSNSNRWYGIRLLFASNHGNVLYHNGMTGNQEENAVDGGNTSQWYSTELGEGNYYGDYQGTDANGDGIGDTPYTIAGEGGSQDLFPLLQPWSGNLAPVASFGYYAPDTITTEGAVHFKDKSADDGTIAGWLWDFGDGQTSLLQHPQHQYASPGGYLVRLTVTDDAGATASTLRRVVVRAPGDARWTWTVDDDGEADFGSLQEAVSAVMTGDTILVHPGHYVENILVDKRLIIRSTGGAEVTVVQAADATEDVFEIKADSVALSGFTITGATSTSRGNPAGIYMWGGNNSIEHNIIKGNHRGIYLAYGTGNLIYLNDFLDNTQDVYNGSGDSSFNTPMKAIYSYGGLVFTGYLGNYWDSYSGSDSDGDGVGDTPHDADSYPLIQPIANYEVFFLAGIDMSRPDPQVSDEITFTAEVMPVSAQAASYAWDLGDGTRGEGKSITHAYSTGGGYSVTLMLTTEGGESGSVDTEVTVFPFPVRVIAEEEWGQTFCLGPGKNPQLLAGQAFWEVEDGRDREIAFYDRQKTVMLSNNDIPDASPQLGSQGELVWLQGENIEVITARYSGTSSSPYEVTVELADQDRVLLWQQGSPVQLSPGTVMNFWEGPKLENQTIRESREYGPGGTLTHRTVTTTSYYGQEMTHRHNVGNGQVIWVGRIPGVKNKLIFLYDGQSTTLLTDGTFDCRRPQIDETGVAAWECHDGNDWEIFAWDGQQVRRLTDNDYDDTLLQVDGGMVLWQHHDGQDVESFLFDGVEVIQLTDNERDDWHFAMDDGQVVWQGHDGNDYEIFLYDHASRQVLQLTDNAYDDELPVIDNGQVAWKGFDGSDYEIYFYDGESVIQITDNDYDDRGPRLHNGLLAWRGHDGHDYEIFFYNGERNIQLSDNDYDEPLPPLLDDGIVLWQDSDGNGIGDVCVFNFSVATDKNKVQGDINLDGAVDLEDAVLALQVLAGKHPLAMQPGYAASGADVDGDNKIGMPEIIFILQKLAGLRAGGPLAEVPLTVTGNVSTGVGAAEAPGKLEAPLNPAIRQE